MRILPLLLLFALSGCTTPDAATRANEDSAMAWDEAVDDFLEREVQCNGFNKTMVVRRTGTRIRRGPTTAELRVAQCF